MLDFKLIWIKDHDDGTVEARIRVYRGAVTTEDEKVATDTGMVLQPVTRFRRTEALGAVTVTGQSRQAIRQKIRNAIEERLDPRETIETSAQL